MAVVGAGVAGLSFAARFGDTDVFEEHAEVGLPAHCTGLVSEAALRLAEAPGDVVLNSYDELLITDLEGRSVHFKLRRRAYLIDRPGLDRRLAERARRLYLNKRVAMISRGYVYTSGGDRYGPYDYIVIAEGSARRLSSVYGHVVGLAGVQVDVKSDFELPGIAVVYNRKLSRAYFSWIVGLDRGLYRVGLADTCCVVERLGKLVKIIRGKAVRAPFGGTVLAGPPLRRLVFGRVILIGSAAGLVKPLSGGGVALAAQSGRAAAEALARDTPSLYERATTPLRLKLRLAFEAFRALYGMRLIDVLLHRLDGESFVAVDYDDHVKTLAAAALMGKRSLAAGTEALVRYLLALAEGAQTVGNT